jgi:hypothetical protein
LDSTSPNDQDWTCKSASCLKYVLWIPHVRSIKAGFHDFELEFGRVFRVIVAMGATDFPAKLDSFLTAIERYAP